MEYPKTDNLFKRDPDTHVLTDELVRPEFAQIKHWLITEKIDGMNIRVQYDQEHGLRYLGRSDKAQLPPDLVEHLAETFTLEKLGEVFPDVESFVIYGEGYGAGIQKGGGYSQTKRFRVFDVLVEGTYWLKWADVLDVCAKLGANPVPCPGVYTVEEILEVFNVPEPLYSFVASLEGEFGTEAEGVIARTDPYLFDSRGRRIMFKYKLADHRRGKEA